MSTRKELIEITADVILNSNISREDLIFKLTRLIEVECSSFSELDMQNAYNEGVCDGENGKFNFDIENYI
jgi:hypothetical protein